MAHPKRQHSKQRTRKGRTHKSLKPKLGAISLKGSTMGYQHRIDPMTGMYKGQQIVAVVAENTETHDHKHDHKHDDKDHDKS